MTVSLVVEEGSGTWPHVKSIVLCPLHRQQWNGFPYVGGMQCCISHFELFFTLIPPMTIKGWYSIKQVLGFLRAFSYSQSVLENLGMKEETTSSCHPSSTFFSYVYAPNVSWLCLDRCSERQDKTTWGPEACGVNVLPAAFWSGIKAAVID